MSSWKWSQQNWGHWLDCCGAPLEPVPERKQCRRRRRRRCLLIDIRRPRDGGSVFTPRRAGKAVRSATVERDWLAGADRGDDAGERASVVSCRSVLVNCDRHRPPPCLAQPRPASPRRGRRRRRQNWTASLTTRRFHRL